VRDGDLLFVVALRALPVMTLTPKRARTHHELAWSRLGQRPPLWLQAFADRSELTVVVENATDSVELEGGGDASGSSPLSPSAVPRGHGTLPLGAVSIVARMKDRSEIGIVEATSATRLGFASGFPRQAISSSSIGDDAGIFPFLRATFYRWRPLAGAHGRRRRRPTVWPSAPPRENFGTCVSRGRLCGG